MSPDDIKKRIVNEIKARGYDDNYIDKNEEREIVQIAIQLGVTVESALAALNQVCDELGYVLESRVLKHIEQQLVAATARDGLVDQAEFDAVFASTKKQVEGKRSDREVKALIVTVMERTGHNKVRKGWFSNWYASLKQELGLL
jgi:hypothetical protein